MTTYLRLHAIALSDDDGGRAATIVPADLAATIERQNRVFAPAGIEFLFDPAMDWEAMRDTWLNSMARSDGQWPARPNAVAAGRPGKTVVFLRWGELVTATGNGNAAPPDIGWAIPPSWRNERTDVGFVTMPGTRALVDQGGGFLLAHELGHFLGLYHTFPHTSDGEILGVNGGPPLTAAQAEERLVRYVRSHGGTVAALDGDFVGDTASDPGALFWTLHGHSACGGQGSVRLRGTLDGTPYDLTLAPPRRNVMSYYPCPDPQLTQGQLNKLHATLEHPSRSHLVAPPAAGAWTWLGGEFSSPPAVVSWAPNRLDVFALGRDDRAMYQKTWDGSRWLPSDNNWTWLGGEFSSPPAVVSWAPNRLDVFALGADDRAMYQKTWDGSRWLPSDNNWTWLGGEFSSPPAVVSWAPNRLDVFALGADDRAMYQKTWDGSRWLPSDNNWTWLGGEFSSPPAVVSWAPYRLDVFALGDDDRAMYQKTWDGSRWLPSDNNWTWLGGEFSSPPAVVSWAPYRLDVFALGADDRAMYQKTWDGSRWLPSDNNWTWLGGEFSSPPAVVSWAPNRLDVFALGADDRAMYQKTWDGSRWLPSDNNWTWLGGEFSSPPAVVSWAPNRLDVFALGRDDRAMYQKTWDGSRWLPS